MTKLILNRILLIFLVLSLVSFTVLAIRENAIEPIRTSDEAKIQNRYHYRKDSVEPSNTVVVFVHGFSRSGDDYYGKKVDGDYTSDLNKDGSKDFAKEFTDAGFDVVVLDKRFAFNSEEGLGPKGYKVGFEDQSLDLKASIKATLEHFNDPQLFDEPRNYEKVIVVGHSEAAQDLTALTNSSLYDENIERIYEIAPASQGSNRIVGNAVEKTVFGGLMHHTLVEGTANFISEKLFHVNYDIQAPSGNFFSLIPGAVAESSLKAMQLNPSSEYMKRLGNKGPRSDIPTKVLYANSDYIVGLNQLLDRDDIMVERIDVGLMKGFGHGALDLGICADIILEDLRLGAESPYFKERSSDIIKESTQSVDSSRIDELYEQYGYNAYAAAAGYTSLSITRDNVQPDESFDVSTFVVLPQQSIKEVQDLYAKLAYEKGYEKFAEHYEYVEEVLEAQAEFDALGEGDDENALIVKWQDKLGDKSESVAKNYYEALEEIYHIPDVAALAAGFGRELMSFLQVECNEPVRMIKADFPPSLVEKQPVLILPSGALSGLDNSDVFKEVLKQYVSAGGTVICFAQQYGYEFSVLPDGPSGYGWVEDQACHGDAVYVDMDHAMLAGQEIKDIDAAVDGYFTKVPENAKVILRRTKNQYPTLIEYAYGNGRVIATTMYEDWAYGHAQSTKQARKLMRDMISWAKATSPMLENSVAFSEYNRGDTVNVDISLEAASFLKESAAKATLFYTDANRNIISQEIVELNSALDPGQQLAHNYNLTLANDAPLGVCYIDYDLLNTSDEVIQPRAEGTAFAVKLPELGGGVRLPDFQMWATSFDEIAPAHTTIEYRMHVRNNTDNNVRTRLLVDHQPVGVEFDVTANAETVFDYPMIMPIRHKSTLFQVQNIVDDEILATTFRYQKPMSYSVRPQLHLNNDKYVHGETLNGTLKAKHSVGGGQVAKEDKKTLLIKYFVTDTDRNIIYQNETEAEVFAFKEDFIEQNFSFVIPETAKYGRGLVRIEIYDGTTKIAYNASSFDIQSIHLNTEPNYPDVYSFNSLNTISFLLDNVSEHSSNDLTLKMSVYDQKDNIQYAKTINSAIEPNESLNVIFDDVSFGEIKFENYKIVTEISLNELNYTFEENISNNIFADFNFDKTKYNAGDDIAFTLNIKNKGDFDIVNLNYDVNVDGINFSNAGNLTLSPKQEHLLSLLGTVPLDILTGVYNVDLSILSKDTFLYGEQITVPDSQLKIEKLTLNSDNAYEFKLANIGGGATDYLLKFNILDLFGNRITEQEIHGNLIAGDSTVCTVQIPEQTIDGDYIADVEVNDITTQKTFYKKFTLHLEGIRASMLLNLDKQVYKLDEDFKMELSINNNASVIDSAKLELEIVPQTPFGTLYGTVKDVNSQPLAGVEVRIDGKTCYTNSSGVYKFNFVSVGEHNIELHKSAYHSVARKVLVDNGMNIQEDTFINTRYGQLNGVILGEDANVIPNAKIELKSVDIQDGYSYTKKTNSDSTGQFSFANIPYGEYEIKISASLYDDYLDNIIIEKDQTSLDLTVNFKQIHANVNGTIINALNRQVVEGATITLGNYSVVTDLNGDFLFADINVNPRVLTDNTLIVEKENVIYKSFFVPLGSEDVDLGELYLFSENVYTMHGQVTNSKGEPVEGARLVLTAVDSDVVLHNISTEADGIYNLEKVIEGTYQLSISRNFYNDYIKVHHITDNSSIDIQLSDKLDPKSLELKVLDYETDLELSDVLVGIAGHEEKTDIHGNVAFDDINFGSSNELCLLLSKDNFDEKRIYLSADSWQNDLGLIKLHAMSTGGESDSNDSFEDADYTSLDDSLFAKIDVVGDEDYFKFEVSTPSVVNLKVFNGDGGVHTKVYVYDSAFNLITQSNGSTGTYRWSFDLPVNCVAAGEYYIKVEDRYNTNVNIQPYEIAFSSYDVHDLHESNNDIASATDIEINQNISASIYPVADKDYYKFYMENSGVLSVELTDISPGTLATTAIYDESGNRLTITNDNRTGHSLLELRVDGGQYYYCLISDRDNYNTTKGTYNIKVSSRASEDLLENNNSIETATAIDLGRWVKASIDSVNDIDFYKINIGKTKKLSVYVEGLYNGSYQPKLTLNLYSSDGTLITNKEGYCNRPTFGLNPVALEPGEYYVSFSEQYADGRTYKLIAEDISFSDGYEINDTTSTAYSISPNQYISANIYPAGDSDFYQFEVNETSNIRFEVANIATNQLYYLEIYDSNGNLIKQKNSGYGAGWFAAETIIVDVGDYYAKLYASASSFVSLDNYRIKVDIIPLYEGSKNNSFETADELTHDSFYKCIFPAGDVDYYSIDLPSAGVLGTYLDFRNLNFGGIVKVYDSQYNEIYSRTYTWPAERYYEFAIGGAGRYYLSFQAQSPGEYSLVPYHLVSNFESSVNYTQDEIDLYKETIYPVDIDAISIYELNRELANFSSIGDYSFQAKLTNSFEQIIDKQVSKFSIQDTDVSIWAEADGSVYSVGDNIKISGSLELGADAIAGLKTIELINSNVELDSLDFNLASGEKVDFEFNISMEEEMNELNVTVLPDNVTTTIKLKKAKPEFTTSITAPDKAGFASFTNTIEITNVGNVDLTEEVCYEDECKSLAIPVEQTQYINFEHSISEATEFTYQITGTIEDELKHKVDFAENVSVDFGVEEVYPEGTIVVPYSLSNTGEFDSEFSLDVSINDTLFNKTYFIPIGQTITDNIAFDLTEGEYKLNYTTVFESKSFDFKVAKFNNTDLSASFSEISDNKLPITVALTNLGYNQINGRIFIDTSFATVEKEILVDSSESISEILELNSSAATGGEHDLNVKLIGEDGLLIDQVEYVIEILPAEFKVTNIEIPDNVVAGQTVELKLDLLNDGGLADNLEFKLDMYDLYKEDQIIWLEPGQSEQISFSFLLDENLEDRIYHGEYELNGMKEYFDFKVEGIKINVDAQLDKPIYSVGETATLKFEINSDNSTTVNKPFFIKVHYGDFEHEEDFVLDGDKTINVSIPIEEDVSKVFYAIYAADGRSIHLNTKYIYTTSDIISLYTDKDIYNEGDAIVASGNSSLSGNLELNYFDHKEEIAVDGNFSQTLVVPSAIQSGTYDIAYKLKADDGTFVNGVHKIDIHGLTIKIWEKELDRKSYAPGETLNARVIVESNRSCNAIIKTWIASPSGQFEQVDVLPVNLEPINNNLFELDGRINSYEAGIHKYIFALYDENDELLASTFTTFDLGGAIMLDAKTENLDYTVGDETVKLLLTLMGNKSSKIYIYESEQLISTNDITVNDYQESIIEFEPINKGIVDLVIELDCDGVVSKKDLSFKYGYVSPASDLDVKVIKNTAKLLWQKSKDADVIAYQLHIGSETGVYDQQIEIGDVDNYILDGLEADKPYFVAIKAIDKYGNHSILSNEVIIIVEDVVNDDIVLEDVIDSFTLTWVNNGKKRGWDAKRRKKYNQFMTSAFFELPEGITLNGLDKDFIFSLAVANENFAKTVELKKRWSSLMYSGFPSAKDDFLIDNVILTKAPVAKHMQKQANKFRLVVAGRVVLEESNNKSKPENVELGFSIALKDGRKVSLEQLLNCKKHGRTWTYIKNLFK